ncbi:MAG: hypothetical protein F4X08_11835 [Gemmatimonadetes bacterium]|nr:hypothetical protein [Gemmatimonadota bacterium]MYD26493.1 hypothetical protein [Gemmatimonadota bacterium]MYI99721.1 hypothetical protein [Gemmatimonadota bacterium]
MNNVSDRSGRTGRTGTLNSLIPGFLMVLAALLGAPTAHGSEDDPAIWRKMVRASTTVHDVFLSRTPQIVIYGNGLVVFRDDDAQALHRYVRLVDEEVPGLYLVMQTTFGVSSLTNEWLDNELTYARSIQEPYRDNNDKVTIWIGMHSPPSLHTYSPALLKARSVNDVIAPAWNAMYKFNLFLAGFTHPRAEPYVPYRVEIAVQHLPRYMADQSGEAVDWPLDSIDLAEVKGKRPRGYRTLTGSSAREAYGLLTANQVIRSGDQLYLVWVRPVLLP